MNPYSDYETMSKQSRILLAASAVILILACIFAGCSSSSSSGQAPSAAASPAPAASVPAITIKNMAFSPEILTVKAGTTVTWTNDDSASHTVVSDDGSSAVFKSSVLASGASFPFTFKEAGTYSYHCGIHPLMKGTIVVQP
jgi:plastocyanin